MSQTDKLLDSLSNDDIETYLADANTEEHIVITAEREVIVPDSLRRIAVQHDHNIETVTFDCPRYWDEHDMSKMAVYINYATPSGAVASCICTNVRVDEADSTIMHFEWTISENVTIEEGFIAFLACVKKTDSNGVLKNHWNSELCKDMYVSEGLELPEDFVQSNPDILTQILLFHQDVLNLNKTTLERASVYVGSGEMPDWANVQIDPSGFSTANDLPAHGLRYASWYKNKRRDISTGDLIDEDGRYTSSKFTLSAGRYKISAPTSHKYVDLNIWDGDTYLGAIEWNAIQNGSDGYFCAVDNYRYAITMHDSVNELDILLERDLPIEPGQRFAMVFDGTEQWTDSTTGAYLNLTNYLAPLGYPVDNVIDSVSTSNIFMFLQSGRSTLYSYSSDWYGFYLTDYNGEIFLKTVNTNNANDIKTVLAEKPFTFVINDLVSSTSGVNTWYGVTSTNANTAEKVVTTTTGDFKLVKGARIGVKFLTNTVNCNSLIVDNTERVYIRSAYDEVPVEDGETDNSNIATPIVWHNLGQIQWFTYDGKYFIIEDSIRATAKNSLCGKVSVSDSISSTGDTVASSTAVNTLRETFDKSIDDQFVVFYLDGFDMGSTGDSSWSCSKTFDELSSLLSSKNGLHSCIVSGNGCYVISDITIAIQGGANIISFKNYCIATTKIILTIGTYSSDGSITCSHYDFPLS